MPKEDLWFTTYAAFANNVDGKVSIRTAET